MSQSRGSWGRAWGKATASAMALRRKAAWLVQGPEEGGVAGAQLVSGRQVRGKAAPGRTSFYGALWGLIKELGMYEKCDGKAGLFK